jgi:hypothetical protein
MVIEDGDPRSTPIAEAMKDERPPMRSRMANGTPPAASLARAHATANPSPRFLQ